MLPVLREYQEHDLHEMRVNLRAHRSVLLVQPTGAGKGTLASYVVHSVTERGRRTIFMVNRRPLVNDMSMRVHKLGIKHGVIMGNDKRYNPALPVQVASIDTLHRREHEYPADLLIVDEAHFAVSPTWRKVLDRYPNAKVLGLTATPIRTDGRGLGEIFEVMVQGPSVQSLIDQGYLVPAVVFRPQGAPSLDGVTKVAGEFNQRQLAEVCDKPKLVGDVVAQWKKYASDRKTVDFAVNQHHAQEIAEKFRCAGYDWAYVDADTPDDERDRIWDDFDYGNLNGVSSVGVISYGWDHAICSCIIGARATASMGLWRQMLGRASRPYPDKENFFVMDHFDNTGRLNALFEDPIEWSLGGNAYRDTRESVPSVTTCRKCFATFRSGPELCPYCQAPIPKRVMEVETIAGELEEFRREQKAAVIENWRERQGDDERRAKFNEFCRIARMRGYKSTWPAVRFKIVFGQWPPKEWRAGR